MPSTEIYSLRWRSHIDPFRVIVQALALACFALLFGLILPGLVARYAGVLYRQDMLDHLNRFQIPKEVKDELHDHEELKGLRTKQLAQVDKKLATGVSPAEVPALLALRQHLAHEIETSKPKYTLIAYYLSQQTLLWPGIYTSLLWIGILFPPSESLRFRLVIWRRDTLCLAALLWVFYEWPLWLRNFGLHKEEGRFVYAYPNWDINPASFVTQEIVVAVFCLLMAVVWRQWTAHYDAVRRSLRRTAGEPEIDLLTDERSSALDEAFRHWVYCSIICALGFIGFTAFFWDLVAQLHDKRYLLSAVLAHFFWGTTWLTMSMPLLARWQNWGECRVRAFQRVARVEPSSSAQQEIEILKSIEPISSLAIVTANSAAVFSFVLPIVQAFVK